MATFERGVQDQLQAIRPPDDLMQFNAQVLTAGQSQYDQAHNRLSKMYGTILNAGLTREDNILAREEFFKLINQDLHKIAGMDLSKQSNVAQAQNVFKQFYTNKPLVKDMVWTKNFQTEMQRAEEFRNCIDPEKCGGEYWEDGVKFMQYKREEFKNATRDESMGFADVRYVPYNNVVGQALKDFKEMGGFDMTSIDFSPDGRYQITTKNGGQAVKPLTALFGKLYQNNPKFHDMFKVMAYNGRKDWIYQAVANGEYESVEAASVGYIETKRDILEKEFNNMHTDITHDYDRLKGLAEAYEKDYNEGKIQENTKEWVEMNETLELFYSAEGLKGYSDMVKRAQKSMYNLNTMNAMGDYLDETQAQLHLEKEVREAAEILSYKDTEMEIKEDEYALLAQRHQYALQLEGVRFKHDQQLQLLKNKDKEAEFRAQALVAANQNNIDRTAVVNFNPSYEAFKSLASKHKDQKWIYLDPEVTPEGLERWAANIPDRAQEELKNYVIEKEKELLELKMKANSSAIKAADYYNRGKVEADVEFELYRDPGVLSSEQINMLADYAIEYPNNAQLTKWGQEILMDPLTSKYLGIYEKKELVKNRLISPNDNIQLPKVTGKTASGGVTRNRETTFLNER